MLLWSWEGTGLVVSCSPLCLLVCMQALVAEMVGNFSKRLEKYGIIVRELT